MRSSFDIAYSSSPAASRASCRVEYERRSARRPSRIVLTALRHRVQCGHGDDLITGLQEFIYLDPNSFVMLPHVLDVFPKGLLAVVDAGPRGSRVGMELDLRVEIRHHGVVISLVARLIGSPHKQDVLLRHRLLRK